MFTSPAIRIFHQENTDTVPRKPGTTTVFRKPFADRSVNGFSPAPKNLKQEPQHKHLEPALTPLKFHSEDHDLYVYDTYSFKDMKDNYDDIRYYIPKDNIDRFCCNYDKFEIPLNLPPDVSVFVTESIGYYSDDDCKELEEEIVEDVSLPSIELDDSL